MQPRSQSKPKPIPLKHIPKTKKGWDVSTSNKFKRAEFIYSLREVQNGNIKGCKKHSQRKRLHGQNRPEGRLLLSTNKQRIEKIRKIRMERQPLRIPMPNVRSGSSPNNIFKTTESTHVLTEKNKCDSHNLHRRHIDNSPHLSGSIPSTRFHNLPITESRLHNQFQKIGVDTVSEDGILRSCDRQQFNDFVNTRTQSSKDKGGVIHTVKDKKCHSEGSESRHRKADVNSNSTFTSPLADTIPAERHNQNIINEQTELRSCNYTEQAIQIGTNLVDGKYISNSGETFENKNPRPNHILRCSEGSEQRMGGALQQEIDGGPVDINVLELKD